MDFALESRLKPLNLEGKRILYREGEVGERLPASRVTLCGYGQLTFRFGGMPMEVKVPAVVVLSEWQWIVRIGLCPGLQGSWYPA